MIPILILTVMLTMMTTYILISIILIILIIYRTTTLPLSPFSIRLGEITEYISGRDEIEFLNC